jgi:hypothetical protein
VNLTPAAISALAHGDLDNFATAATPGGIEAQEAAGQAVFVANSTLPKECPRADLEKLGVKFGEDHDDLFVKVTLPAGWTKKATDHSMHSDLLDDKGRKRASIFYKAAFYDRRADMYLMQRYKVNNYQECDADGRPLSFDRSRVPTHWLTCVMDCETILHVIGSRADNAYKTRDVHGKAAEAWLDEKFPLWRDVTAYWD